VGVPVDGLQIESGMLATDTAGRYVTDLPEFDLRYGLLDKTELRLTLPDYFHDVPAANASASGLGDTAIGVKQQVGPLGGFDLAVIASVGLPTGSRALSSHGYDPAVQLPWSRSLPANWQWRASWRCTGPRWTASATRRGKSPCCSTGN